METAGLAASLIATVDAGSKAVRNLKDVKDAPVDPRRLAVKVTGLLSILLVLQYQVAKAEATEPWLQGIQSLAEEDGPLDQSRRLMEDLARKYRPVGKSKESVGALMWTLEKKQIDDMFSKIDRLKTDISLSLKKDQLTRFLKTDQRAVGIDKNVSDIADGVSAFPLDQKEKASIERRRLMAEWISPLDFHQTQYEVLSRRQSDTGKWFLESEQFNRWLQGKIKTLWCPGMPGAGKTIIAATVIDHLQREYTSTNTGIAYIYCNGKEQTKQTSVNLIGSLLQQLAQQNPSILDILESVYRLHSSKNTRPTLHGLSRIFQSTIHSFTNVFIVIDALDECCEENGSRDELLESLGGALAENARFLVTSRPNVHVEERFPDMEKLEIVPSGDEYIRNYLDARISQTPKLVRLVRSTPALRDRIVESILEKAEGRYLLAKMHMDSLSNKINRDAVLKALQDLPSTIVEAYDEAFKRIEAQKKDDRQLAMMAIYLITLAEAPLTVRELQHALAVNPGASRIEEGDVLDEKTLLTVCGGLIHIERKTNTVRLIHASTADYIRSIPKDRYSDFQIEMYQQALEASERVLDPDNASTLREINDLGLLYSNQGKLTEAEEMIQRELMGYESTFGPDLEEANQAAREAIKATPEDHPTRARRLNNLGIIFGDRYSSMGAMSDLEEAIQAAREAIKAIPEDHPDRAGQLSNLGIRLGDRYSRTGAMSDHLSALNAMKDLGNLYSDQGKLAEAGEIYQQALIEYGKAFGPNHPLTVDVDNKLGTLYADQDKLAEAQAIKRQASYSREEFTTSQDLADSALEGASVYAGSDLDDHSSTLEAGLVRAGSDSGYGSMTHNELSSHATIPSRALVFDSVGRDDLEGHHETQEYSEDEEVRSVFSNQEDIKSQMLMKKTEEEMIAEDSLGVLLAQNRKLTPFYEEALKKIGKARFIRNFRKLLKQYYLDLLQEAKTNLEQATVHLLRSNATRKRLAQIIVDTIIPEHEEARLKMEQFVQDTKRKELDIEGWIVRNSGFTPPPDLFLPPTWENANLENSSSEEDSDGENDRKSDILPNVAGVEAFLIGGTSFQALSINLGLFLLPNSLDSLTQGIMSIPRNRIWFSTEDDVSLLNRMKSFMEDLTEESWNWWPLRPSMRRLKKDQIRLHWQCHCGQHLWSELSTRNARLYELVLEQRGDISQYPHLCRMRRCKTTNINLLSSILQTAGFASSANHRSQSSGSSAADSPQKLQTKGVEGATPTNNTLPSPQRPSSDDPADEKSIEMPSISQLFVLFGVKGTRRTIDLAQINVKEDDEDSVFFCNLQRKYREYRGYWRYWFSVWQLTHCNFIKFEKIRANRVINAGEEIPTDSHYVYNPRAPNARCPPITRHEFELALRPCSTPCIFSSFHDCLEPPIGNLAIDRIPKRKSALELRTSRMELAWGLHAQHDISAIRLVLYHFFICAGPLAVWIWWQTVRPTDPQNAVVPLTTVGLFLSVFWSAAGVLKFRDSS